MNSSTFTVEVASFLFFAFIYNCITNFRSPKQDTRAGYPQEHALLTSAVIWGLFYRST